jgi:hypothetical protein
MEQFDLTNKEGLRKVAEYCGKNAWKLAFPQLYVAKKLLGYIMGSDATIQQTQAAEKLIQKGKENGVDEMEIVINNTKGVHFECPVEEGIKVNAILGSDEKMHIKVKYK